MSSSQILPIRRSHCAHPAVYGKPCTRSAIQSIGSIPYLLCGLGIVRTNHAWAADIISITMRRFIYLFAVLDWASRRVLARRISNALTPDFCLNAVREAITQYDRPEIFNTDQGCQFTSLECTGLLKDQDIQISTDGRGCWWDNVFGERLWRSLKYEEVYLQRTRRFVMRSRGLNATSTSIIHSGHIVRLTDARPIACTRKTAHTACRCVGLNARGHL